MIKWADLRIIRCKDSPSIYKFGKVLCKNSITFSVINKLSCLEAAAGSWDDKKMTPITSTTTNHKIVFRMNVITPLSRKYDYLNHIWFSIRNLKEIPCPYFNIFATFTLKIMQNLYFR